MTARRPASSERATAGRGLGRGIVGLLAALLAVSGGTTWAAAGATPFAISKDYRDGDRYMGVRLRGALRLPERTSDGAPLHGLSGLAWDADEGLLYAVSDLGYLVTLRPRFDGARLVDVDAIANTPLRDAEGRPLRGFAGDAEEVVARYARNGIAGDTELVIAFEHGPRLVRYRPDGRPLGDIALPSPLADARAYANANNQLEAITETARHGWLAGPEHPLRDASPARFTLYAADGARWDFAHFDAEHGGLTSLATLADDSVLALERRFISPLQPLVVCVYRLTLDSADAQPEEIARLDTSRGWAIDNFEGIAWHEDNRVFLVSDDNARRLQSTVLLYLELLPPGVRGPGPNAARPPLVDRPL